MTNAIIIISYTGVYGWKYIIDCYNSIRNIDKNILVIIVNNYKESLHHYFNNDINLRYIVNETNAFELGSIKTALYSNPDIDYFYIVHDSCIFNSIIDFTNDTIFWKTTIMDISPVMHIISKWCDSYFPGITYNDPTQFMCQGLMGYISRTTLLQTMEYGLKYINVTCKSEAVASEGMFGIILHKINPNICTHYNYKLNTYIIGEQPFDFLVKLAAGKNGGTPYFGFNLHISTGNSAHPSAHMHFIYNNIEYDSLHQCIEHNEHNKKDAVISFYKQNSVSLDQITIPNIDTISIENDKYNISDVLQANKHYFYTLKHFNVFHYESI